jgi:hypothetical protein
MTGLVECRPVLSFRKMIKINRRTRRLGKLTEMDGCFSKWKDPVCLVFFGLTSWWRYLLFFTAEKYRSLSQRSQRTVDHSFNSIFKF